MVQSQFIATHAVAKRQKLLRASSEQNMPDANAKHVASEVIVIDGPECENASCTLV